MNLIKTVFFSFFVIVSFGQGDPKTEAISLGMKAIELMDNGEINESIKLLKKAEKLDPENYNYPYEIGFAYMKKGDLKKAIDIFEKVVKYDNITDQCYQMLGNAYDMDNQRNKAIIAYTKGLKLFPEAGNLYYELGVVQDDLSTALTYFEKGIEVDPTYPTNYYAASRIFLLHSENEVWGMIYGEIFMNIERGSKRTEEISKLLYDTYSSEITFSGNEKGVSFCKNVITINDPDNIKFPFGLMVYEPILTLAIISVDTINLRSLNIIRTSFAEGYASNELAADYPNLLFSWHQELIKLEYIEAYNYWVLSQGNPSEFEEWYQNNKEAFTEFIDWFSDNPMKITNENKFVRYD